MMKWLVWMSCCTCVPWRPPPPPPHCWCFGTTVAIQLDAGSPYFASARRHPHPKHDSPPPIPLSGHTHTTKFIPFGCYVSLDRSRMCVCQSNVCKMMDRHQDVDDAAAAAAGVRYLPNCFFFVQRFTNWYTFIVPCSLYHVPSSPTPSSTCSTLI